MRTATRWWSAGLARVREAKAVVFLALLFAGFLVLSLVAHSSDLLDLDRGITRGMQRFDASWLRQLAGALTFLGSGWTLVAVSLGAAAVLYRAARPVAAVLCLATLISHPANMLLKAFVDRPRPEDGVVHVLLPAVGLSFPSGHAMSAVLSYGFLSLMCWTHLRSRKRRLTGTVTFATIVFGISFSRIYLGAHWFSDVLGGWTAGLFLLLLLAELYKVLGTRELVRPEIASAVP